jgi:Xaa-Pro aminopeptidase
VNRRYFTGLKSSAGVVAVFREAAYLLVDSRYHEKAKLSVTDCDVIKTDNFYKQIQKLCAKHDAVSAGIEAQTLTVSGLSALQKALKGISVDSSPTLSDRINSFRSVKTDSELIKIKTAQRIAEDAFEYLLNYVKPGVTEKDLAFKLNEYILKNAEAVSFETIVLSGVNTAMPHGEPSEKEVESGEFVLFDFGAVYDGYHSDMTRTVCVGQADDYMSEVYDVVLRAQRSSLESIGPGAACKTVDGSARRVIADGGFGKYFGHGAGHGVGLEIHEKPLVNQRNRATLAAGHVVTCEPGIYIPGKFGVRIEDMVFVTPSGYENLTGIGKDLLLLK